MATKLFVNSKEMESCFNQIMEEVIEAVSQKLLKDFLKHLDETIYAAQPGEYTRYYKNGGFYSGWKIDDKKSKQIGNYVRSLVFDGKLLVAPQNDMINSQMSHGGDTGADFRNVMMQILNDPDLNFSYSYNGGAKYFENNSQGYWDSYMNDLDVKINKWFSDELKKYGIQRG